MCSFASSQFEVNRKAVWSSTWSENIQCCKPASGQNRKAHASPKKRVNVGDFYFFPCKSQYGSPKANLWKDVNILGELEGLLISGKLTVVDQRKPVNRWKGLVSLATKVSTNTKPSWVGKDCQETTSEFILAKWAVLHLHLWRWFIFCLPHLPFCENQCGKLCALTFFKTGWICTHHSLIQDSCVWTCEHIFHVYDVMDFFFFFFLLCVKLFCAVYFEISHV